MCACNFDMQFTYVHSGWEESANDSRVMQDALGHVEFEFPWPPTGKKNIFGAFGFGFVLGASASVL